MEIIKNGNEINKIELLDAWTVRIDGKRYYASSICLADKYVNNIKITRREDSEIHIYSIGQECRTYSYEDLIIYIKNKNCICCAKES